MFRNILKLINEVHYTDYFPKQFVGFVQKYKDKDLDNLYVHFSNFKSDILDKRIVYDPGDTHSDPVGVYAFPADYVVEHPSDIGFGTNRKYLSVLLNKVPEQTLYLQNMDKEQFVRILSTLFPEEDWDSIYEKEIDVGMLSERSRRCGKFFYRELNKRATNRAYPSKEINQFLVSVGIKVLIDSAPSKERAIIHEDEPHQAVFLTRDSFDIIEVFELRKEKVTGEIATHQDRYLETKLVDKIINMLGSKLKDRLTRGGYTREERTRTTSIDFKGENIQGIIHITYPDDKEHRDYSDYSDIKLKFNIANGYKRISQEFKGSDKIEHIVDILYKEINS